jgi:hypothetical protein
MNSDAAVVDTFLHTQDTAYSVPAVLEFIEKNNLKFKGWLDNGIYYGDWEGFDQKIADRDRWSITENLTARIPQHRFMVSRAERTAEATLASTAITGRIISR